MIDILNTLAFRLGSSPHSVDATDLRPYTTQYHLAANVITKINQESLARPDIQRLKAYVQYTQANSDQAKNWDKVFTTYLDDKTNLDVYEQCGAKLKRGLKAFTEGTTQASDRVMDIYDALYLALNNLQAVELGLQFVEKIPEETRLLFLERLKKFYAINQGLVDIFVNTYKENKKPINANLQKFDRGIEGEFQEIFMKLLQAGHKQEGSINLEMMKLGTFDSTFCVRFSSKREDYREVYRQHCAPYSVFCFFTISSLRHTNPAAFSFFTDVQKAAGDGVESKAMLGLAINAHEAADKHDEALQRTIDEWLNDAGMPSVIHIPGDLRDECIKACNQKYGVHHYNFDDDGANCLKNMFGPRSRGYRRVAI